MKFIIFVLMFLPGSVLAGALNFPDQDVDFEVLSRELMAVGARCRIVQTNRLIENGSVMLETQSGLALRRAVTSTGRKVLLTAAGVEVHPSTARPRTVPRYIRLKCDEDLDRSILQAVLDEHNPIEMWRKLLRREAQSESAHREMSGVVVDGVVFSTDAAGIARLHGLMVSAQRKEAVGHPVNIRRRNKAGAKVLVTSAAQAEAMFDAASGHVEAVQDALYDLHDAIDAMTLIELKALDVQTWAGWP